MTNLSKSFEKYEKRKESERQKTLKIGENWLRAIIQLIPICGSSIEKVLFANIDAERQQLIEDMLSDLLEKDIENQSVTRQMKLVVDELTSLASKSDVITDEIKSNLLTLEIKSDIKYNDLEDRIRTIERNKGQLQLKQYVELAESKISVGDFEAALKLFNDALLIAKEIDNKTVEIRTTLGNAECYFYLKELNKALRYAEESIKLSSENNDKYYLSLANMILAQIYEAKGDIQEAYKLICEAQKVANEFGDKYNLARISLVKVRFSLKINRIDEAIELLNEFSEEIKKRGGKEEVLAIELEGIVDISNNKFKDGEVKISDAIKKAKEYNLYNTAFDLSINLGRNLFNQKKLNDAKETFEDSFKIAQKLDSAQVCVSKLCIAETLYALNELNDALQNSNELLSIAQKHKISFVIGECYLLQSVILIDKKDFSKVYKNIRKSFKYFQEIDDFNSIIRNLILLGDLCLKSGIIDYCYEFLEKYEYYRKSKKLTQNALEELNHQAFAISDNIGEFDSAIKILDEVRKIYPKSNTDIFKKIDNSKKYVESKKHLSETFQKIIECETPDELAGTKGAANIHEANRWVLGPFLDWVDGTEPFPGTGIGASGLGLIYDLWGQTNFSRLLLNLKSFPNVFHLAIEVSSVKEAREACRTFLPITDCLTLIWKGRFDIGTGFIPRHLTLGIPEKGWQPKEIDKTIARGYPITVAPMVCCTLPHEILEFYINEARSFIIKGKLILAPAPMVGCSNIEHSVLEEAYCKATNGYSIQKQNEIKKKDKSIPLIYPYFPGIDLETLSKIIDDEEDSLKKLRLTLLEWSCDIERNGFSPIKKKLFVEKFREMSNPVSEKFVELSKKKSINTEIKKSEINAESEELSLVKSSINTSATVSSSILWSTLKNQIDDLAGFACFRLMGLGKKWELRGPQISIKNPKTNEILRPEMFNWLKLPGEHKTYMMFVKKEDVSEKTT